METKEAKVNFIDFVNPTNFINFRQKYSVLQQALEFPKKTDEEWKYTSLNKLINQTFKQPSIANTVELDDNFIINTNNNRIVFVDGIFNKQFSSIVDTDYLFVEPVTEEKLNSIIDKGNHSIDKFTALALCNFTGGIFLDIPKNKKLQKLVEILFISTTTNGSAHVLNCINLDKSSEAQVSISYIGNSSNFFTNTTTVVNVSENARLEITKLQNESTKSAQISNELIHQQQNSYFKINTITLNGNLIRNNLTIKVDGENCETHLQGVVLGKNNMHVDNHTCVDHIKPNCMSNEKYKNIVNDESTSVFNGKIFVRRDAQKINAYQNSANLLLSDKAHAYTKPELEIYADDVKCSHGTTTGNLDDKAIFYLRSRGLNLKNAEMLFVTAFAGEVIEAIDNTEVKNYIYKHISTTLDLTF